MRPTKQIIFVCTLQKANVDVETVRQLAELMADLGVLGVFNGLREEAATEGGDAGIDEYAPSQAELRAAFDTLGDLKRRGYPILNSHTHMTMMREGPPVYRCHWPKFMLPVEANGDIVDCMHWGTRPIGNLKQTTFAELLEQPAAPGARRRRGRGLPQVRVDPPRRDLRGVLRELRAAPVLGHAATSRRDDFPSPRAAPRSQGDAMAVYTDRAEFDSVMERLFERLMAMPALAGPLTSTEMVVRFRYPDLGSVLTFDFKHKPAAFSPRDDGAADVEMVQSSDTAHEFWLGQAERRAGDRDGPGARARQRGRRR